MLFVACKRTLAVAALIVKLFNNALVGLLANALTSVKAALPVLSMIVILVGSSSNVPIFPWGARALVEPR